MTFSDTGHAEPGDFRRLTVDLYVPPGGTGYWEGAIRQADDRAREEVLLCIDERSPLTVELLYGDEEGNLKKNKSKDE